MYYDKSVIPEEDVDSLEKLIADCEAAGKYFAFEMQTSAWYLASFFFATGCVSEWKTDDSGAFIEVHDTFNSPEGLIAVKGMNKLVKSPMHLSSSKASEFASGAAIVVTGIWDYTTAEEILGDNMGVTDLPSFEVDGTEYHLGSFSGCKLLGVKPQVDAGKATALTALAGFLTGEQCQLERFEARAWGPSNLAAQGSDAVQANPGLIALQKQNQYATVQGQIHGSWWDIGKVIGDDVKAAEDDAGLQAALDNYYDKIAGLFTLSDDVKNGWTIIGTYNEADGFFYTDYSDGKETWTADLAMVKGDDGLWKTEAMTQCDGAGIKMARKAVNANLYNLDVVPVSHIAQVYNIIRNNDLTPDQKAVLTSLALDSKYPVIGENGKKVNDQLGMFFSFDVWAAGPTYYIIYTEDDINAFKTTGLVNANVPMFLPQGGTVEAGKPVEDLDTILEVGEQYGDVYRADSLKELAEKISVPNLAELIEDNGKAYYAVRGASYVYSTCGGLEVDTNINVVDVDGNPVPGLYATGNDSIGVLLASEKAYVTYGGAAAGWALTSGRLAGANAAAFAKGE